MDSINEWTSLPMPELLTRTSCNKDWKRISAESSLKSPDDPIGHGTEVKYVHAIDWDEGRGREEERGRGRGGGGGGRGDRKEGEGKREESGGWMGWEELIATTTIRRLVDDDDDDDR